MASLWFYKNGDKEVGPVAFQELVELLRAGKLTGDHRVRRELSPEWVAARDVIALVRAARGQPVSAPPAGGESAEKAPHSAAARSRPGGSPLAPPQPIAESAEAVPAAPSRGRRKPLFVIVAAAVFAALALAYRAASSEFSLARLLGRKATLREEFSGNTPDRRRWLVQQPAARVGCDCGELRAIFSPNRGRTSTVGLESRFQIEGDFEIRTDYVLNAAEPPKKNDEEIKVDICIEGPDGKASVMRGMRLRDGDWYACWADRTADTPDAGLWMESETKDRAGSLCLRRSGEQLSYLVAGPKEELRELDSIRYGFAPIETTRLRVWVPSNDKPVEISYRNLKIEASRLVMAPTARPRFAWGFACAAVVLVAIAGGVWYVAARR